MNKYKRLNIYLSIAKESLENPNNVNHELFKQYCKNESNPFQSNKITINLYDQYTKMYPQMMQIRQMMKKKEPRLKSKGQNQHIKKGKQ